MTMKTKDKYLNRYFGFCGLLLSPFTLIMLFLINLIRKTPHRFNLKAFFSYAFALMITGIDKTYDHYLKKYS